MKARKIILEGRHGLVLSTNQKKTEGHARFDHCYKFIYAVKGAMHYQSQSQDVSIADHQFILFNPLEEHRQLAADNHKFLIEIHPNFLIELSAQLDYTSQIQFANTVQKNPQITRWVQFMSHYIEEDSAHQDVFIEHSLTQLVLLLLEQTAGSHSTELNVTPFKSIQPHVALVMDALKQSYNAPWSLAEMAQVAHMSKYQFAHIFKETTGISPFAWLQLYRVVRSQEALIHSDERILIIALSHGFSSVSVYTQLFKRLYGVTPRDFRQKFSK
ncbi:helix-turn-helix domain-containing protein [Cytobacillus purgationiresistens]|uniref:AraC-like DNA-binding protein n=1 Tax=Cytobacillus purgationiresistens TaxID=863449 RepID=A0ABU0ANN5_9BACI|nr:AraC family transcriptional regulator [Cytobacillus purgationiresistens]MDQ0272907.1 AraC-like DNA-binding protein [Cytobacillus purgationiresistens]